MVAWSKSMQGITDTTRVRSSNWGQYSLQAGSPREKNANNESEANVRRNESEVDKIRVAFSYRRTQLISPHSNGVFQFEVEILNATTEWIMTDASQEHITHFTNVHTLFHFLLQYPVDWPAGSSR